MKNSRVTSTKFAVTLTVALIAVINAGCSSTTTYRSKIEASRAAESYREQAGTRKESYVAEEERTVKVPNNAAVEKAIVLQKSLYKHEVTACSKLKEGTVWTEKLRSDHSLPWGWRKYVGLGKVIDEAELKNCFAHAELRNSFELTDSDLRWLPPRFIEEKELVEITKFKDVANIVCKHEDVSRQWVCWNTNDKDEYKYFKY